MSERSGQNYQNHVMVEKKSIVVSLLTILTVVLGGLSLFTGSMTILSIAVIVCGLACFGTLLTARLYCTKLQDRIIRTEMKLRLREVLEPDLATRAEGLITPQLIALRFASDAELPGLVQKVLDENIKEGKAIKQLVTDWQGDYDRV